MDKIITMHDYWDGPKFGLATYNALPCIFERAFSKDIDDYTDFYNLTLIDQEIVEIVMKDWNEWILWMCQGDPTEQATTWQSDSIALLKSFLEQADPSSRYHRRAKFHGTYHNAYTEINDLFVTWIP